METKKIAVLPGDGIGEEVMNEALKVLEKISKKYNINFEYTNADIGGVAYFKHGTSLPKETVEVCEKSDAILLSAVGDPRLDNLPPEEKIELVALLGLRKHFDFFANIRPAVLFKTLAPISPIRSDISKQGFDMLIVRELTSGIYFGEKQLKEDEAHDVMYYHKDQIKRIAKIAFDIAMKRRKKVTCVDKSNVLNSSILFRKYVTKVAKDYPEIELDFLYIDNATMQLIKRPSDFDVIVTTNMFGDILSDEAGCISGSLGMLGSASLNEKGFGMYEPAGGSAPKYKGTNKANPIAQIMSAAMMLKYSFSMDDAFNEIEKAITTVLEKGFRTKDIMVEDSTLVTTSKMGDLICEHI